MRSPLPTFPSLSFLLTVACILSLTIPITTVDSLGFSPAIAQTQEDRKAEADRFHQQGVQQYNISQFQQALQSWQQALEIYKEIGDQAGEGSALSSLGAVYNIMGEHQRSIEFLERALAITRQIDERVGEGQVLTNLGRSAGCARSDRLISLS